MDYLMVGWPVARVVPEHMVILRQIAVQMLTGIHEADKVNFTHELCEGRLERKAAAMYGGMGGTFFFADFGQANGKPQTVDFFIPRHTIHTRIKTDAVVTMLSHTTDSGRPEVYTSDIDTSILEKGKLHIRS